MRNDLPIEREAAVPADPTLACCRRRNYVHAAFVDAAITIQASQGTERATALLQGEGVGTGVIDRVLAPAGRHRRRTGMPRTPAAWQEASAA